MPVTFYPTFFRHLRASETSERLTFVHLNNLLIISILLFFLYNLIYLLFFRETEIMTGNSTKEMTEITRNQF